MNESQLATTGSGYSIMPQNMEAQINEAVKMRDMLTKLFNELLVQGTDYDRIPGTDKPTLLKPGAELLCKTFRLSQGKIEVIDKSEDWESGVFSYTIGMPLIHIDSGNQIAYGIGAANSMEKKHRYRRDKDGSQVNNPEPADLQNTLVKMASKRAFIDAVFKATNASRMFSQEMDGPGGFAGEFEKASSKQVDYIKKLYGGVSEATALAEISSLCDRDVTAFDEIYRSEASRVIDTKKGVGGSDAAAKGETQQLSCVDCPANITKAENEFSNKKYGRALCRKCQAKAEKGA